MKTEAKRLDVVPGTNLPWNYPFIPQKGPETEALFLLWCRRMRSHEPEEALYTTIENQILNHCAIVEKEPEDYFKWILHEIGGLDENHRMTLEIMGYQWVRFMQRLSQAREADELTRFQIEFLKWLQSKGAFYRWLEACRHMPFFEVYDPREVSSPAHFILNCFSWRRTPEGNFYWSKLSQAWQNHYNRLKANLGRKTP